mgnify:CR=1 FL=1
MLQMFRLSYIFLLMFLGTIISGAECHVSAQGAPDHLFKDDEPNRVQAYVLVTDDRGNFDIASINFSEIIKTHLQESLVGVNFVFVDKISQMKRSGDIINIIVSVRESGIVSQEPYHVAKTLYKVTIYDLSKTPIFIKDGNVSFDERLSADSDNAVVLNKTVDVANQRLVGFLKRSITHKSFHR